jgi:hypothetical protein
MISPCDICVDPRPGCARSPVCNCAACKSRDCCPKRRGPKPTFRITRKCTQKCVHCCWSCSPDAQEAMTVGMAEDVARFCAANGIHAAEVMGGEFFMHPEWEHVIDTLTKPLDMCRLVSNGDWAANPDLARRVIDFLLAHEVLYVCLSKDEWHTNQHVDAAEALLKEAGILCRTPTVEEVDPRGLVPVGRASDTFGIYSMFGCYCHNPAKHYNFLIDEVGAIYKCGFGAWHYADVGRYVEGGFAKRFREFNRQFYKQFVPSCRRCMDSWRLAWCREQHGKVQHPRDSVAQGR